MSYISMVRPLAVRSVRRRAVRSRLWYFLSPFDGASVREVHCAQASTAQCAALKRHARRLALQRATVREAHCAQATGIYMKICAFNDI